jgi:hypothetical protein
MKNTWKANICFYFRQELGLIDAFGNSLVKKPTLSIDDDQAKWKSDKQAKEAADKQARPKTCS